MKLASTRFLAGRKATLFVLLAIAGAALAVPSLAQAAKKGPKVTVMTRNLYLGADLTDGANAKSGDELRQEATEVWNDIDQTDFNKRGQLLADEIAGARPDLAGLQEVALWRTDPDNDAFVTPAETVLYEFLEILTTELQERGEPYKVVVVQEEFDFETFTDRGEGGGDDLRLTLRDVILQRKKSMKTVKVTGSDSDNFKTNYKLEDVAGTPIDITVRRGWTSADVKVGGERLRLVNTHLEAFDPQIRRDQAEELVDKGGPARSNRPVVLLGDLNSDDDTVQGADRLAYKAITKAGFIERGTTKDSCCYQTELLNNPNDFFDHQVDHVMANTKKIKVANSFVTGGPDLDVFNEFGIWPSDHGGVMSTLRLPT